MTGLCVAPAARELFFDSEFPGVKTDRATAAFNTWADANLSLIASVAREAGVPCEVIRSTGGQVYDAIISAVEKRRCDLIVMASHGRKGAAAFLLGSETQKVLTHTKIPVLVYR